MKCPNCSAQAMCFDSRQHDDFRRRRYGCSNAECSLKFTTAEFIIEHGSDTRGHKVKRFVKRIQEAGAEEERRKIRTALGIVE